MFKAAIILLLTVSIASGAFAASSASRLAEAHGKLKANDTAGAIEILRELQVESPGDERVLYALGCAQYKEAESQQGSVVGGLVASGQPGGESAQSPYKEAQESFENLLEAQDPEIARNAAFDRANCIAQSAKLGMQSPEGAQKAVGALRNAANAYQDFLRRFPDDKGAQQNLDHVRFLLKKLLREQKKDEKKDEEKQDQKQDQKNPTALLKVRNAQTEIPGATTNIDDDAIVRLVKPGAGAAQ